MRPPDAKTQVPPRPTPKALGYAMPAEWEPQDSVWLSWPHDPVTFPGRVEAVERIYQEIIRTVGRFERMELLVKDRETEARVAEWARRESVRNFRIHLLPTADVWIRDYGPSFVRGPRGLAMVDWVFNAWGNKYASLLPDGVVPALLEPVLKLPRFEPGIVMEGGSYDVNGQGALLTTEQCLLNANRNPHLHKTAIEQKLRDYLGASQILWLGDGIVGDDTDGHVDDVARFVAADTIVACVEEDSDDPNHAILQENWKRLETMTDARGDRFHLVPLPMPGPVEDDEGERLPASYANFLIANRVVLMPTFGRASDGRARSVLAKVFPNRIVVPIACEPMVHGLGTLHCASQQQPAA